MEKDIRIDLINEFAKAQKMIRQENELKLESAFLLAKLHRMNAAVNLGMTYKDYIAALGLTQDQYYKRISAYRALRADPRLKEMLENGATHLSHLALVGSKITDANRNLIVNGIRGKSKRGVEAFLSTVTPDGKLKDRVETVEVRLKLTKKQLALLDRVRDVLAARGKVPSESDAVVQALNDLLTKRDPLEKAKRAVARIEKKAESAPGLTKDSEEISKSVPMSDHSERLVPGPTAPVASIVTNGNKSRKSRGHSAPGQVIKRQRIPRLAVNLVWVKCQGRCTHIDMAGKRCPETRMLEVDHIVPVCRGGDNSFENLRLLCRSHNQHVARELLGEGYVGPRKTIRQNTNSYLN